ncbi:hypothetical protein JIY74_31195 [Vibrio harveyi]|nr:hypothetical protein [Vibrio harveyi]
MFNTSDKFSQKSKKMIDKANKKEAMNTKIKKKTYKGSSGYNFQSKKTL